MADPDYDVPAKIVEILDTEWDTNNASKPGVIRVRRAEQSVSPGTDEYILVASTQELLPEWRGGRQTRDHSAAAFAEVKTITSHSRRMEIFNEIDRIVVDHRDRRDAEQNSERSEPIGDWDTLDYNATMPDEEIFDVFPIEYTFSFTARSRVPG
jgi:hypothetical protein